MPEIDASTLRAVIVAKAFSPVFGEPWSLETMSELSNFPFAHVGATLERVSRIIFALAPAPRGDFGRRCDDCDDDMQRTGSSPRPAVARPARRTGTAGR